MTLDQKNISVSSEKTNFQKVFGGIHRQILSRSSIEFSGSVIAYDGHVIESSQFPASIGSQCTIKSRHGAESKGEIIGFKDDKNIIYQYEKSLEIFSGDKVTTSNIINKAKSNLLGRVIDGLGAPLDGKGPIEVNRIKPH